MRRKVYGFLIIARKNPIQTLNALTLPLTVFLHAAGQGLGIRGFQNVSGCGFDHIRQGCIFTAVQQRGFGLRGLSFQLAQDSAVETTFDCCTLREDCKDPKEQL